MRDQHVIKLHSASTMTGFSIVQASKHNAVKWLQDWLICCWEWVP